MTDARTSLTPNRFPAGPDRELAARNRAAFLAWLRDSDEAAASQYRKAGENLRFWRRQLGIRRTQARREFVSRLKTGAVVTP